MANPHRRPTTPRKTDASRNTILIIDSDPVFEELLRNYLGDEKGFRVLSAKTGAEGIKSALVHKPNLILLDFRLSDMSGLLVHEKLQEDSVTKGIPVIYVSSFLTLRAIEKASLQGARGFISKPFNFSNMYAKVAAVLGSR